MLKVANSVINASRITGVLPVLNGGTGVTTSTGTTNVVLSDSPTITTPTIAGATLSGTVSGGGNQINNVVIGTSTPLAGSFTTVTASGAIIKDLSSNIYSRLLDYYTGSSASGVAFDCQLPYPTSFSSVGIYSGMLSVTVVYGSNLIATKSAVYSVAGNGAAGTATVLSEYNGSGGALITIAITFAANSIIKVTQTSGVACIIHVHFAGTIGLSL